MGFWDFLENNRLLKITFALGCQLSPHVIVHPSNFSYSPCFLLFRRRNITFLTPSFSPKFWNDNILICPVYSNKCSHFVVSIIKLSILRCVLANAKCVSVEAFCLNLNGLQFLLTAVTGKVHHHAVRIKPIHKIKSILRGTYITYTQVHGQFASVRSTATHSNAFNSLKIRRENTLNLRGR